MIEGNLGRVRTASDDEGGRPVAVPVMGRIAAGTPIEAIQTKTHVVNVPPELLTSGEHFALEVRGDSMIDAGILDGDIALIKKTEAADTGDIVVALIDEEEATLKRFRRRGASIALEPANTVLRGAHPAAQPRAHPGQAGRPVPAVLIGEAQSPGSKSSVLGVASGGCRRAADDLARAPAHLWAQGWRGPRAGRSRQAAPASSRTPAPMRRSATAPVCFSVCRSITSAAQPGGASRAVSTTAARRQSSSKASMVLAMATSEPSRKPADAAGSIAGDALAQRLVLRRAQSASATSHSRNAKVSLPDLIMASRPSAPRTANAAPSAATSTSGCGVRIASTMAQATSSRADEPQRRLQQAEQDQTGACRPAAARCRTPPCGRPRPEDS